MQRICVPRSLLALLAAAILALPFSPVSAASPTQDQRKEIAQAFPAMTISDAEIDALWFARPSHAGREAWEIRLVAEQPYALFEAFESDEGEEDREDARREMENKMREHARG